MRKIGKRNWGNALTFFVGVPNHSYMELVTCKRRYLQLNRLSTRPPSLPYIFYPRPPPQHSVCSKFTLFWLLVAITLITFAIESTSLILKIGIVIDFIDIVGIISLRRKYNTLSFRRYIRKEERIYTEPKAHQRSCNTSRIGFDRRFHYFHNAVPQCTNRNCCSSNPIITLRSQAGPWTFPSRYSTKTTLS